jgi:PPOX class probable F420-dependent enzyme
VLATLHSVRGVDAVPVVYALDGRRVILPIDTLKPKRSTELGRLANVRADSRCVLLVEHYHDDWSALWWVRLHATARIVEASDESTGELAALVRLLAARFPAYGAPGSVVAAMVLEPPRGTGRHDGEEADRPAITGWSASS